MSDFKQYTKLNKYESYDVEAARELAEAMNEARELKARLDQLQDLFHENTELHAFVWTTADGKSQCLQDIEDEHFQNILAYIVGAGRKISKSLKAEAARRNVALPTSAAASRKFLGAQEGKLVPHGPIINNEDDDEIDLNNIPF
jgi:hypothetical protein